MNLRASASSRRAFLATVLAAALAGCTADAGPDRTATDASPPAERVDESRIEACARAYIAENVVDVAELRTRDDVIRAEEPDPRVVSTDRRPDRVVYEVRAWWGVDRAADALAFRALGSERDVPDGAPSSDEPPLDGADELLTWLDEAENSHGTVTHPEFKRGYEDAVRALEDAFGKDIEDGPFVVDHGGVPIEVSADRVKGLHADYEERAYYHAVDGDVYRAEREAEDPSDGEPLEC